MSSRKIIGLLLFGYAVFVGPAMAQEPPEWFAYVDGEAAAVGFAVPDSEDVRFVLYCDHKKRSVSLSLYEPVKGMKVKQPLTIDLSAGGVSVSLRGEATRDKTHSFIFGEANKVSIGPVLAMLRQPGDLTVKAGNASVRFPAKDRAEKAKVFADGCEVK